MATSHSLEFVVCHIPERATRILEVGCGDGDLAQALTARGHAVVALDSSETAIAAALTKGVDARLAQFPEFHDAPFDCVLFSRSLHHILPVSAAITAAAELLKPDGVLLVDDFAFESASQVTGAWLRTLLELLDGAGVLDLANECFAKHVLESENGDVSPWKNEAHHVASWNAVVTEVSRLFESSVQDVPYLYRYVLEVVRASPAATATIEHCFRLEQATGALDPAFLIGRRLAGRRVAPPAPAHDLRRHAGSMSGPTARHPRPSG